jgi:tRNA-specific 2-thiouridylase
MNRKAVALVSGGLDSALAVRIMQEQAIEVEGLHVHLPFACCRLEAAKMALELGISITVTSAGDDYFEMLKNPRYQYGRGANPCTDCRIYLLRMARHFMRTVDASFVVTGEVKGQRPNSQLAHHLRSVEEESGLKGLLLRPLCAKILRPTLPEKKGIVDRNRLYRFSGRSRAPLIELARRLNLETIPSASGGCPLAEHGFGRKVLDLIRHDPDAGRWDFELLSVGRHFRLDESTKVVVSRDEGENERLRDSAQRAPHANVTYVRPRGFHGAHGLIVGPADKETIHRAASFLAGYSRQFDPAVHEFEYGISPESMSCLRGVQPESPRAIRHLMVSRVHRQ